MYKIFLAAICFLNFYVYGFDQLAKKPKDEKSYFEVLIDRFDETFNNHQFIDFSGLKIRKVNKTRTFVGDVIIKSPIENDVLVDAHAYHKQGGEYRLMPYKVSPKPFCDFCAADEYVYPDLAKNSDFPEDVKGYCPFKEGKYNLNGVQFLLENVPKAAASSGDYAAELSFRKNEELLFQFRIYVTIHNI